MAEQVEQFITRVGGVQKYPWHIWADGSPWRLVRGEDYTVSDRAIRAAAYAHASKSGMTVRTSTDDRGVLVQFTRPKPKKKVLPRKRMP